MNSRGVALITAVVLVAIATVLATRIGTEAALDLRRTAGLGALNQGWQVALGAEAWAAQILSDDLSESSQDDLTEEWAQPVPPLPIDGGMIEGTVEDMQARFNVNNLLRPDGTVDDAQLARLEVLLTRLQMDPRWANTLADWLDEDTIDRFPGGAEDGVYISQSPPYRSANGPITTPAELLALPGFTLEDYLRIRPHVAALPVGTQVNVCTATAPVLDAMLGGASDFGDAEALARNRQDGCFPRLEDLRVAIGDTEFAALQPLVSESTRWFRVTAAVSIGTSQLTLYSLLERTGAGSVRAVLRSVGTE